MRYGVQIFGMNSLFTRDKHTFLKALSSAGYRFIEPCLMLEPIPQFLENAWLPSDLEENTALLTTYGMGIHSIHIFTDNILADLDYLISLAQKYGFRQFVLPCPVLDSKQAYLEAAERFCQAADLLLPRSIRCTYCRTGFPI